MPHSPHLVLLGGGHAMLPSLVYAHEWTDSGVEVTLVDPQPKLYYSGMVPEYLGGVYQTVDVQIDLGHLAREAGVTFVREKATAVDPHDRIVTTDGNSEYSFDVLAIDVGGVNPAVPDATVATRPISRIRALSDGLQQTLDDPTASLRLVVVGGGAAGVEVALNVTGRFQGAKRGADLDLTLIEQADAILPGFPDGMRRYAHQLLRDRGATIRTAASVQSVEAVEHENVVRVGDRETPDAIPPADIVTWATGVVGPSFLRASGLPTDDRGFLHVTPQLRTPTHPRIFAAGDCATIRDAPLAKVGVHAVKQGGDLRKNLDRTLQRLARTNTVPLPSKLTTFRPYPLAPLILSTGEREALWTAGSLWAAHPWFLRLKHWIDRRWIRTYAPEPWGAASWRALMGAETAQDGGQ